jgi:hypothetical protein
MTNDDHPPASKLSMEWYAATTQASSPPSSHTAIAANISVIFWLLQPSV